MPQLARREVGEMSKGGIGSQQLVDVHVCPACGWWVVSSFGQQVSAIDQQEGTECAWGTLRNLDLTDISIPIDELRRYLLVKYSERFNLDPRKFEEIVAGVFSDFGYCVRVTSFGSDDGIDVIALDGQSNNLVGVQVKRYRNRIEAEQIRSFAGALMLGGFVQGVFVTTSVFTSGALKTAHRYLTRGIPIYLWDAKDFYDKLRVSQRPMYTSADDDTAPFFELWKDPRGLHQVFYTGWEFE
jgi:restriction system protein